MHHRARRQHRVPGPPWLLLDREPQLQTLRDIRRQCLPHLRACSAGRHDHDRLADARFRDRVQHVRRDRPPRDRVQHFRQLGLHPRPATRRKHHRGHAPATLE